VELEAERFLRQRRAKQADDVGVRRLLGDLARGENQEKLA